jgi:hypothetical protein
LPEDLVSGEEAAGLKVSGSLAVAIMAFYERLLNLEFSLYVRGPTDTII